MTAVGSLAKALPEGLKRRMRSFLPDETRLVFDLVGRGAAERTMLDVGACKGDSLAPFAESGWTVYAFEPDDENRAELGKRWGHNANVHIDARAVSNEAATDLPFFRSPVSDGISSLAAFHETHERAGLVDATTIAAFTADNELGQIGFLKVDTEGFDLFVLEGVDWDRTPPDVVVCEFENAKTRPLGYSFEDLASFLVDHGYFVFVSEWYPVVQYGQTHRWRCFAEYPCSLADSAAWGNLIGVRDSNTARRLAGSLDSVARRWRVGGELRRISRS